MKKVLCISGSRFLIKGEWYEVTWSDGEMYCLYNHTDIKWHNNWYAKLNFATAEELREKKLNELGV